MANTFTNIAGSNTALQWIKIATKVFGDFSTAGLTNTIASGYLLPPKGIIMGCQVIANTAFSGGTIASYTVSVGVGSGGSIAKYGVATNVFTGSTLAVPNVLSGIESISSTTSITLTAISTIGLLNTATTGSVSVYLLVGVLPS